MDFNCRRKLNFDGALLDSDRNVVPGFFTCVSDFNCRRKLNFDGALLDSDRNVIPGFCTCVSDCMFIVMTIGKICTILLSVSS